MRPDLSHLANSAPAPLELPAPRSPRESVLDASEELDGLTTKALHRLGELLDEPFDFDRPKIVSAINSAAQAVLRTQVSVDEGRLKRRKLDALPKLLEMIAREEGRSKGVLLIEGELAD